MFYGCNSLATVPDIGKWDTFGVKFMNLFDGCFSLLYLPELTKIKFCDNHFNQLNKINKDKESSNSLNFVKDEFYNIKINYKSKEKTFGLKIRIFGKIFVQNNKDI